jgi:lactonase family protein with 7-bladed beta-propeller
MKRHLYVGAMFLGVLVVLAVGSHVLGKRAVVHAANGGAQAPKFEVDPMWPKPLPNNWVMGNVIGVSVDSKDHIWIIHRQGSLEAMEDYGVANPPGAKRQRGKVESECCMPAPPVLEFDEAGNLLAHWGGEDGDGYVWPASNHGITVDYKGNVWIGGNGRTKTDQNLPGAGAAGRGRGAAPAGRGPAAEDEQAGAGRGRGAAGGPPLYHDSMIMKFTQDGKFLMKIGTAGQSHGSNDTENLGLPAKIFVDPKANEVYVSDGYGNKRVIVFDADTGKYKRHWGAYGHKPDDTAPGPYTPEAPIAQQFRNPVHCADLSNDGLLYVCDRSNDRIQVFKADGTFVKEKVLYKNTLGDGAVWDIAFSKDPQQKYIYLADGANEKVHILDRDSLEVLTSFGEGGRQPGEFYAVHSIATDSKGNIFTTETYRGQRLQKFVYKGVGPVGKESEGVLWPKTAKSPL